MSKQTKSTSHAKNDPLHHLCILIICSLFVAMSIILGKYLAINGGQVLRFSFENLPVLLAGIWFGPLYGMAVGVVADLIGCLLVGYPINPLVTLGAAAIGAFAGLLVKLFAKDHIILSTFCAVFGAHLVGSVLIKTFGLAAFYSMPFAVLLLWRCLNYLIIGSMETALICFLRKNRGIQAMLAKFK